jgi:hypothetical protein
MGIHELHEDMNISFTLSDANTYTSALTPVPQPPLMQFYRHPHDLEIKDYNLPNDSGRMYMGDGYRKGKVRNNAVDSGKTLPEVYRLDPDQVTPLPNDFIHLWKDINPDLSVEVFGTLLDPHYAWTNNTGWPGHYNHLTGELATDGDNPYEPPAFHAPLVCGGALFKGTEQGGYLYIDNILTSDPAPSAPEVLSKPWLYFYGTQVNPKGQVTFINRRGMDGSLHPVRVPFVTRWPVYVPLSWLDRLPAGYDAASHDPLKMW